MKIPKRITVGRKKYHVGVSKYSAQKGVMGTISYEAQVINLGTHSRVTGMRYKKEDVLDTFWHEVTHAILEDMGHKLEADEKFVTAFANRLTKVITKAEF
jgi:hypothetical protein